VRLAACEHLDLDAVGQLAHEHVADRLARGELNLQPQVPGVGLGERPAVPGPLVTVVLECHDA